MLMSSIYSFDGNLFKEDPPLTNCGDQMSCVQHVGITHYLERKFGQATVVRLNNLTSAH